MMRIDGDILHRMAPLRKLYLVTLNSYSMSECIFITAISADLIPFAQQRLSSCSRYRIEEVSAFRYWPKLPTVREVTENANLKLFGVASNARHCLHRLLSPWRDNHGRVMWCKEDINYELQLNYTNSFIFKSLYNYIHLIYIYIYIYIFIYIYIWAIFIASLPPPPTVQM